MPLPHSLGRRRLLHLAALGLLPSTVLAQIPAPAETSPRLRGTDRQGRVFDLAAQRGSVVMLMFWSTTCAVCRDKMPELRANLRGWQGQPFKLVGVNTDPQRRSFDDWEALVALTVPPDQRFSQLWRGDPGHLDNFGAVGVLPATYLVDKKGRVAHSFHGRVPAEAWDHVADLL